MTFLHASHLLDKPISSRHRWAVDYIMHRSFQCGSCRLSIRKDQQRISVMNGLVPEKKLTKLSAKNSSTAVDENIL